MSVSVSLCLCFYVYMTISLSLSLSLSFSRIINLHVVLIRDSRERDVEPRTSLSAEECTDTTKKKRTHIRLTMRQRKTNRHTVKHTTNRLIQTDTQTHTAMQTNTDRHQHTQTIKAIICKERIGK